MSSTFPGVIKYLKRYIHVEALLQLPNFCIIFHIYITMVTDVMFR